MDFNFSEALGPFFYLIVSLSILMIAFTMFVNFVRGIAILGGSLALGYYILIADISTKDKLDNYASQIFSMSKDSNYVEKVKSLKNNLEKKALEKINN